MYVDVKMYALSSPGADIDDRHARRLRAAAARAARAASRQVRSRPPPGRKRCNGAKAARRGVVAAFSVARQAMPPGVRAGHSAKEHRRWLAAVIFHIFIIFSFFGPAFAISHCVITMSDIIFFSLFFFLLRFKM